MRAAVVDAPRLENDAYPGNAPAVMVLRRPAPGIII